MSSMFAHLYADFDHRLRSVAEVSEYGSLADRTVSKDVSGGLSSWMTKMFAAIR